MNSSPVQDNDDFFIDPLIEKLKLSLANLRSALDRGENVAINLDSLDTRTRNILINYRIQDYLTLSRCDAQKIVKWRNCGKKTVKNIIKLMDEFSNTVEGATDKKEDAVSDGDNYFYYTIAKAEELLDKKYYLKYRPTEEELDKFGMYANCIAENFHSYLEAYKRNMLRDRDVEILYDYVIDDRATLEAVGKKHNLTRERIRQLLIKYRRRLSGCFCRDEFLAYNNTINDCLSNVPYEAFSHFIAFGFLTQYSKRFTLFVLQCLFDNVCAENVLAVALNIIGACPPVNKADLKVEELLQKACFPTASFADVNIADIECADSIGNSVYIERLYYRLVRYNKLKAVIRKPKIVYYTTSSTEHVPDFGLLTEDDRFILVVALPTINMAIRYNLNRFNALHKFCKENGYGYIITDDRFNSIYDIKNSEINSGLAQSLFGILYKYGRIGWSDIQQLKSKFNITNFALAAFIIQNNLKFSLNPFMITLLGNEADKNETLQEIQYDIPETVLPETQEVFNGESAYNKLDPDDMGYLTVEVGKYEFICDKNGVILTDGQLFEELKKMRWDLAEAAGVPKFYIFSDSQLISLATFKPINEEEWVAIKGLGPGKFRKYGEQVIEIIKKHKTT